MVWLPWGIYTEHQGEGTKREQGSVSCFGFLTCVRPTKQMWKNTENARPALFLAPGCGSRKQSGVSVLIHPLGPDQIQWRATKNDVTIPQLSQPLSVAPPNACVCVKGSDEVKLDALSPCISLSLILSSLQTRGDSADRAESCGLDRVPTVCVCVYKIHTLQNVYAGNGVGREWGEMKEKCGFFYHHSLSACIHTSMYVNMSVTYYVNAAPLHHSFSHAKHCRIITVCLRFPQRGGKSVASGSLSHLIEFQWIEIQQFADLFV